MQPHGDFKIIYGRQVILAYAYGSWNAEAFALYRHEMERIIANIQKPFSEILDISQWELGNQAMLDAAKMRNEWAITQGRCHMSIVYGNQETIYKITDSSIFSKVDASGSEAFSKFRTIEDALAFLKNQGYYTDDILY